MGSAEAGASDVADEVVPGGTHAVTLSNKEAVRRWSERDIECDSESDALT